ncbi:hypothetical protein JMJ35_009075 [Cladonia borealis]|uniref:GP-PDE domain-containing protein n=1 Tax=Cladonia borealis TaxID=184061 RepID=A0AA39V2L3_9LECA|nr:hypothetical protein JMJ35_009075 [Cladonia borealis]
MTTPTADTGVMDLSETSLLYLAARDAHEDVVKAILASATMSNDLLNKAEASNGWTPLFIACINGHLPIVRLLLEAGAERRLCDLAGWTEKEHAVFRGHMKVAELLAAAEFGEYEKPLSSVTLRAGIVRPGDSLRCTLKKEIKAASRLEAPETIPSFCRLPRDCSHIFVTLGPSNTRSHLKFVDLDRQRCDLSNDAELGVMIESGGIKSISGYSIKLPILDDMINKPLHFTTTEDLENLRLVFQVFFTSSVHDSAMQIIGTGVILLRNLHVGFAHNRGSLMRDFTVPILENGSMTYIGTVTTSILLVTPFLPHCPNLPRPSPGFWEPGSTQVVGHRGFGANSTARTNLQLGENTVQSFLTAYRLGASCVEFDVQLTKDYVPVIFHDFLVMETGGDVPLHMLTFDQFMHLSHSQVPKRGPKKRSHSLSAYNDRSHELLERMKYTEEGLQNSIKGNLRGYSIQELSSTLEQLLTELPESIAFNVEIKYPMLWEAEDRGMEPYAMELNFYVDTILSMIFRLCGNRNITLSSFSPEICILLAYKQETFPILFISKAGTVPVGDIRAGSLKGAIDFAQAWGLAGIVVLSDPFVMCPRLLTYAKDSGLVVGSYGNFGTYGNLTDEPECAVIQAEAGLDAIMTNKVRLISEALSKTVRAG